MRVFGFAFLSSALAQVDVNTYADCVQRGEEAGQCDNDVSLLKFTKSEKTGFRNGIPKMFFYELMYGLYSIGYLNFEKI